MTCSTRSSKSSWDDCMELLDRTGLRLPSEAQWEYGARAGTNTVWWTGSERESLKNRNAANLADQAAARVGATWGDIRDWPELDDGFAIHAPVNRYEPNAFGLYNVHGNVWEHCLDAYEAEFYRTSHFVAPVNKLETAETRVNRGASFYSPASDERSSYRNSSTPEHRGSVTGLRPARAVE